jgi:hypothetical protein
MRQLPLLGLGSDPSSCKTNGSATLLESAFGFLIQSPLISGGSRFNPESPTNVVCELTCG